MPKAPDVTERARRSSRESAGKGESPDESLTRTGQIRQIREVQLRSRMRRRRLAMVVAGTGVAALIPVVGFVTAQQDEPTVLASTPVSHASPYPARHWGSWWRRHHAGLTPTPTPTPSAVATTVPPSTPPTTPASSPPGTGGTPTGGGSSAVPSGVPKAGVPAGVTLTASGAMTISKAGTVVDAADIRGGVTVTASNVVIRRSRISGSGDFGVYVRSGSLTLEDSTVTGFDNSVAGDNYTATRVEVTRANDDGFKIGSNVTIQDSWCHDLVVVPGAHSDCGQIQAGIRNAIIRRNWFDVGSGDGNAALFMAPDLGPSTQGPLLVENNVLGGGNFTVQCVDGADGKYFISDITIRNNTFLRNSRYGALRVNVPATVTGNTWRDTKAAVSA